MAAAVCFSVSQCGAMCCSELQRVAVRYNVLQCATVGCSLWSVLQPSLKERHRVCCIGVVQRVSACFSVLKCLAVSCSVKCVAVCCSVKCVAVCCSVTLKGDIGCAASPARQNSDVAPPVGHNSCAVAALCHTGRVAVFAMCYSVLQRVAVCCSVL